jgi:hypothetical protein
MLDESEHTGIVPVPVHILRTSNDDTVDVKEGKAFGRKRKRVSQVPVHRNYRYVRSIPTNKSSSARQTDTRLTGQKLILSFALFVVTGRLENQVRTYPRIAGMAHDVMR